MSYMLPPLPAGFRTPALAFAAIALAAITAAALPAEVVEATSAGFSLRGTVTIQAPPADVYRKLVTPSEWWSSSHTFSGDAANLAMEARPGGCFCEKLPNGGGVHHMEVVYVNPAKTLVLHGALGPLQSIAAVGSMTFDLTPEGQGTKLAFKYIVAGYQPGGMVSWANPVDGVLAEQVGRLKSLLETGAPAPRKAEK